MSEHCYLFLDLLRKLDRWMCRREFFTDPPAALKWQRKTYCGKAQCFLADVRLFALNELTRQKLWIVYKYLQGLANHIEDI